MRKRAGLPPEQRVKALLQSGVLQQNQHPLIHAGPQNNAKIKQRFMRKRTTLDTSSTAMSSTEAIGVNSRQNGRKLDSVMLCNYCGAPATRECPLCGLTHYCRYGTPVAGYASPVSIVLC